MNADKAYIPGLFNNMDEAIAVGNSKFASLKAENEKMVKMYLEEKEFKEKALRRIIALKGVITKLKNAK